MKLFLFCLFSTSVFAADFQTTREVVAAIGCFANSMFSTVGTVLQSVVLTLATPIMGIGFMMK